MKDHGFKNFLASLTSILFFCLLLSCDLSTAAGRRRELEINKSGSHAGAAAPIPAEPRDIEQIFIPAGSVALGSDKKEKAYAYEIGGEGARKWRWFDAEGKRRVFVDDFYIDKYPVTQAQYLLFVQKTGHRAPFISAKDYQDQGFLVHSYKEVRPYLWDSGTKWVKGPGGTRAHRWARPPSDKLDNPVVLVSAGDGAAYCEWRGKFDHNKTYNLPTENQWEKAARGTDGRYFPWGDSWDNRRANIWSSGVHGTTPVDRYKTGVSPYGVFDMAGNIFEWTVTPSEHDPARNILKSCSWDDMPGFCRGAARHSRLKKSRHILIGFRCAGKKIIVK